jgi:hypothetical protein
MGKHSAEYALVTIIVVVIAYLVITPIATRTANLLKGNAELIVEATNG